MNHYMNRKMVDRLFALMKENNISTQHICNILNVTYPDFIAAVNGKHPFYNKWQRKICTELGIDREILFREFCVQEKSE